MEKPKLSCCVKNCDALFKNEVRSFYYFPLERGDVMEKWMKVLGLNKKSMNFSYRVCDKHFTSNDYGKGSKRKKTAVPSQYLDIDLDNLTEIKTEDSFESYKIQECFVQLQRTDQVKEKPKYTCRICLQKVDQAIWVFEPHEEEKTVAELFEYCTGLQVSPSSFSILFISNVTISLRSRKTTMYLSTFAKRVISNWWKPET